MKKSALRKLDELFESAEILIGKDKNSSTAILETMGIANRPSNLLAFYELLSKATKEARTIEGDIKLIRYLQKIEWMNDYFTKNPLLNLKWKTAWESIEDKGCIIALNSLVEFHESQFKNPFIDDLIQQIIDLLIEISDTDLPEYLKSFLNEKLNEILEVAENYIPNKAQELSKTSRNAMFEFASWQEVIEKRFREHPVVIRFVKIAGGILLVSQLIGGDTTSNIVGTIADGITIYSQFSSKSELAEEIYIKNDFNIKRIIEEVSTQTAEKLKALTGTEEPKALPPADEESVDYKVINDDDEPETSKD